MKYLVVLCDGMADYPVEALGGKTPLEAANTPNMDKFAKDGYVGLVKTVSDDMKPGSDVANLSVLGYDPHKYYTGRSPLEAGSIGIDMKNTDVSLRCNLVTLTDEAAYEDKTIVDYCAGDISTEDAKVLVDYLAQNLDNEEFKLYSGVSYRHCLIWNNGTLEVGTLTPPHDITGKPIKEYIPAHPNAAKLYELMKKSYDLLKDHPLNKERVAKGLRPANSMWLWGEGVKAQLDPFKEKYGLKASMISAVDLLKGIGKFSDMNVVNVEGATGYIDTNFAGKAKAAIEEFKNGQDFVYIHVEAPDECGHRNETENKKKSIEIIDEVILGPVTDELRKMGDFKVLVTPDHATPLSLMTHTNDPIPFIIYDSTKKIDGPSTFNENTAKETGNFIEIGYTIMNKFINGTDK
ncbi:MAG: cofactor-independent phosphoglycerate mutase [Oscillospiraceae bacterium]|nr:cofactor-independent phosphoglycerate mutase [Oscillospiraceae bacterium]MBQ9981811.1 cofactor-independent phosphoglycerate mutase [Oscillospiraceae bacterium]